VAGVHFENDLADWRSTDEMGAARSSGRKSQVRLSLALDDGVTDWRHHQIPSHQRERGGVSDIHACENHSAFMV
jgi:hypothetical protein